MVPAYSLKRGCYGGAELKISPHCRQLFAHPGEIAAAQTHAEDIQRMVLSDLPQDRISVVVTVCTDFTTFTYNQPAIVSLPGVLLCTRTLCQLSC